MAITTTFPWSNQTNNTDHPIVPIKLGVITNYGVESNTGTQCVLTNRTCAVDTPELVTYQSRKINKVNTSIDLVAPNKVKSGVQYGVQTETVLKSSDDAIGYRVDDPIVVTISVRHTVSGHITDSHIETAVKRAVSYLFKDNGNSRLGDLMRGAEQPVAD
jgi:hypothetical protein